MPHLLFHSLVLTLSFWSSVSLPRAASLLLCQLWFLQGWGQETEHSRCSTNKQMNNEYIERQGTQKKWVRYTASCIGGGWYLALSYECAAFLEAFWKMSSGGGLGRGSEWGTLLSESRLGGTFLPAHPSEFRFWGHMDLSPKQNIKYILKRKNMSVLGKISGH